MNKGLLDACISCIWLDLCAYTYRSRILCVERMLEKHYFEGIIQRLARESLELAPAMPHTRLGLNISETKGR